MRRNKICPFNNKAPSCTKDKAKNPLGVCSIFGDGMPVITCPIRFRERWIIVEEAANFFFDEGNSWTSIAEVRLADKCGKSAGNIRAPFEHYMADPKGRQTLDWHGKPNYPKPDYLSSSRKRLVPQVLYKGGILRAWGKKQAVALQRSFFETLPKMKNVERERADLAWFLYDLKFNKGKNRYILTNDEVVYTEFEPALDKIITPNPGKIGDFVELLQEKLDQKLDGNPPDAPSLGDVILS